MASASGVPTWVSGLTWEADLGAPALERVSKPRISKLRLSKLGTRALGVFIPGVLALGAFAASGCSPKCAEPPPPPLERPSGPLERAAAEQYVLKLVNRHRAAHDLPPVEWDEAAAEAGRRHAADMAARGFTAHLGSDGSVPEQRYSESGGAHLVQENAACFFDGVARELDPEPRFDPRQLEAIQDAFYNEVPPHDGHRTNILKRWHTGFGVGLAKPRGVEQPCMAQEFVDEYAKLTDLPKVAARRQVITVSGELLEPAVFGAIGLGRIEPARPLTPEALNQTSSYHMPAPDTLYSPAGFVTPKPVQVNGNRFSIELELGAQAGRYLVSVWARMPGSDELTMVSLRTITVK
ncbi:MAG: CAP domain-containing protein [Polyangiaceae bacterium]|nr:CAP domain-containing protein [Polyangiaceae bacterium]MCW5791577.1 CAP domain-containing protein [Polyangiaceae bacterium]